MDPLPQSLRSVIDTLLRERHTQGAAVCGFDRDGIRLAGGVGYADVARAEMVTPSTVFRVASISKLFTTSLVLRLADSGEIDLDEPVNRYLPHELRITDAEGRPAPSRVRSLLSHTSGLPSGVRGADLPNAAVSYLANGGRVRDLADAITGLRVTREVDETIVYSNPAFNVLGYVAARVLGGSFEEAARDVVLEPLELSDSAFTTDRAGPGVATPYGSILPPGIGARPADGMQLVATPMGGLTTTVVDLARFGRMVLNGGSLDGVEFLRPDTLDLATTTAAVNHPGLDQGYGLGFKVRTSGRRRLVGHDGNMPGVATQLVLSPDDGVGAVVLTNGYSLGVPHQIAAMTLGLLTGGGSPSAPGPERSGGEHVEPAPPNGIAGSYSLRDVSPPGPIGWLNDSITRVRIDAEAHGRLRVTGNPGSDGPMWLCPDGGTGSFRVSAAVDDGTNAVVEERADGPHLWLGYTTHLQRRGRRSRAR